jgi:hypothetical protein
VLYNDEPINLTCSGEKRFGTSSVVGYKHHHQSQQPLSHQRRQSSSTSNAAGGDPPPRRVFLALYNCRSSVGLLLHYRLEVFGNVDPAMCSSASRLLGSVERGSMFVALSTLLFATISIADICGHLRLLFLPPTSIQLTDGHTRRVCR